MYRLPSRHGPSPVPGARRERDGREHGTVRERPGRPRDRRDGHRPSFHLVVPDGPGVAVGGHSYGGRVASLAAAEPEARYDALILFSYPTLTLVFGAVFFGQRIARPDVIAPRHDRRRARRA